MMNFRVKNVARQFLSLISISSIAAYVRYLALRRDVVNIQNATNTDSEIGRKNSIIFLMNDWGGANVPFYQLYLAKLLYKRKLKIEFLHDCYSMFPSLWGYAYSKVFLCDRGQDHHSKSVATFGERREILKVVKANIVWLSRSELFATFLPRGILKWLFDRQLRHFLSVKNYLTSRYDEIDLLIIPGGVYSVSSSYVLAAKRFKIDFYTYDSGADGELIFCKNGIAAHMEDVDQINVSSLKPDLRYSLYKEGEALLEQRAGGNDEFRFQKVPSGSVGLTVLAGASTLKRKVLVPLSCPWDAASLLRKDKFENEVKFLNFVLERYCNDTVIVRVHPVERFSYGARNDNLKSFYSKFPNCIVIAADANVNTYDLLNEVDLLVCRNTSIGLEAHISGVPVISTTKSYWNENCDFKPPVINKEHCMILYALAQKHSWVFPECNLQNVRQVGKSCPDFPEFQELIENRTTITKLRSNLQDD